MSIQSTLRLPLKQALEAPIEIRAHRNHMTKVYLHLQARAFENVQEKSEIQTLAVITSFIKAGATLRWGYPGWEIRHGEIPVRSEIIDQLCSLKYAHADADLIAGDEGEPPSELVKHLLSSQNSQKLDAVSRRAFQATQSRAYFEYLDGLMELYQGPSRLHEGGITYRALARERLQFWHHFAWLYLAGALHLFGVVERFRVRLAQRSLDAISLLIP